MAMVSSYWRLKLIESTLRNKSPKRYKELKKTGQLDQFVNEIDKQIMDIYESKRKYAFSMIKKQQTEDDPQILQKLQQADKKAWTNTLHQFIISADFESKKTSQNTNENINKRKSDLHASDSRPSNNLRSRLDEVSSSFIKEALAGKHVPQRQMEYPIQEEKILTGETEDRPEYKVSRQQSPAEKKPEQSKLQQEKSAPSATRRKSLRTE